MNPAAIPPGMITAMTAEVINAWTRIVAVLAEHAPAVAAAVSGPASDEALAMLEREIGQVLPDELLAWLRLADGTEGGAHYAILPSYVPCGVDWIVREHQVRLEVYGEEDYSGAEGTSAGDEGWPVEFYDLIPIAGSGSGDCLVVDLRPGRNRGCVMEWFNHGELGAGWPSIAAMLADVADALEHGRPEGRKPTDEERAHRTRVGGLMAVFLADGDLDWEFGELD